MINTREASRVSSFWQSSHVHDSTFAGSTIAPQHPSDAVNNEKKPLNIKAYQHGFEIGTVDTAGLCQVGHFCDKLDNAIGVHWAEEAVLTVMTKMSVPNQSSQYESQYYGLGYLRTLGSGTGQGSAFSLFYSFTFAGWYRFIPNRPNIQIRIFSPIQATAVT